MGLGRKCSNCGSRDLDDSLLQEKGEVSCRDCGVIQEDYTNLDSSRPPLREGDDTRAGGPVRRQKSTLTIDDSVRDGDRVWNLPSSKKRGFSKRKKEVLEEIEGLSADLEEIEEEISQIESKIDEIKNLEGDHEDEVAGLSYRIDRFTQQKSELERDLVPLFAKIHGTGPPGKNEDWMFMHQARDFLQLGPKQGDEKLDRRVKELCPDINWVEIVTDIISNPSLPDRAPEGDD